MGSVILFSLGQCFFHKTMRSYYHWSLFSGPVYALYSCADPVHGLCVYLTREATNLMVPHWEVMQQCVVRHSFRPDAAPLVEQQLARHLSADKEREMLEPPGYCPLLPAGTKEQLNLLHLPFWPLLKVCRLHGNSLMTLRWRGVNNTVLFTDAVAEHK